MIDIVLAGAADAERLVPLYMAFYREDHIAVDEDRIRNNIPHMLGDARAAIWLALSDGTPVGLASASLTFGIEFGWSAEIEDLYVSPDFRGQAIARRLIETAISFAENHTAHDVMLIITPEAEATLNLSAFYAKFGFETSGRRVMYRSSGAVS